MGPYGLANSWDFPRGPGASLGTAGALQHRALHGPERLGAERRQLFGCGVVELHQGSQQLGHLRALDAWEPGPKGVTQGVTQGE